MPLKRHPYLQDYSREHHDELMLVWKIREGLKKNISVPRIVSYCIHHYNEETRVHMENEEKYILNLLPDNDADKVKILGDHSEINRLVNNLAENSNDPVLPGKFADILEKHIRFEERDFFPRIQSEFTDEVLKKMQPVKNNSHACEAWHDQFWEK